MPSYQGKRDLRHKEMCPKNRETRESVRKPRHTEPRAGTSGNVTAFLLELDEVWSAHLGILATK